MTVINQSRGSLFSFDSCPRLGRRAGIGSELQEFDPDSNTLWSDVE